jgi:hypothetical protein
MSGYLETNLNCLERRDPVLKERLQWPSPDECDIEIVRGGRLPSLRRRTAGGEWRLLHTTHDPEKEGHRWAEGKDPKQPVYNLILLGAGLWYHIRLQGTLENLVIIEQSDAVLRAAFQLRDLTEILDNEHTYLLANPTAEEIRGVMNKLLTTLSLDEVLVAEHEPSIACSPEFYAQVKQTIDECLQAGQILLRTKVQMGGLIQENLFRNLPTLFTTPAAAPFRGVLQGIPCFIVAAGPSLDRNKRELLKVGYRAAIIAVDTTYPLLRREGIRSHLSVTADPSPYNLAHFMEFPEMGDTVLFYAPSVYWEVLKKVRAKMVSLPLPFSKTLSLLPMMRGVPPYIKTGLNVAQTALNLAIYLGCNPIILVGLDLSFERSGGGTHAKGAALRRTIVPSSRPGYMVVELLGDGPPTEEFEPMYVPANDGGEVPTSRFWLSYLRSIEQDIAACTARCINATEGGARIQGTEIMSLSETINQVCLFETDVTERLHRTISTSTPYDSIELTTFWKTAEEVLKIGRDKAREGQQVIAEMESRLAEGNLTREESEKLVEEVTSVHRGLVQNQRIYSYLDEAADRVLSPFLRKSGRPRGDPADLDNLRKTVERYRPFFRGMDEICSQFLVVVRETSSETPKSDEPSLGAPILF